ncbi:MULTISPECIES: cysteine desulfurase family protein [unclassified Streptomyces]|uniref:cysteine desulfurase family protein n=1 Tax=unclassified Streptomyces TaxID=2593676 RepID=UPI0006FA1D49|nr:MULTISPECIES: cysteine desulfurase family protein [unclassified Streptomyces]KQX47352.1 cysteine desulfurase [Streptomyces sp. Root1304]KRA94659.1 cysteine desulfurase [Streptomyces sp. Root66D1]
MSTIYLDHQATTPTDPAVVEAMSFAATQCYANPSSPHAAGIRAFREVERARGAVARFIGAGRSEICFTSGATEGNNLAIKGVVRPGAPRHVVTTAVEHKSVLDTCRSLREAGHEVTVLPVDGEGRVDPARVAAALRPETALVSVMLANNEIATVQPVAAVAALTRAAGVPLHCDATQGVGSLPVDVRELGVDLLTFSGHKIYGPKGVGVLYVSNRLSDRAPLVPQLHGGGQERGLRAGTLNTAAVIGLGTAVGVLAACREAEALRLAALRELFLAELADLVPYALNSRTGPGFLPHAVNLSFPDVDAQQLLLEVADVAVSTGSACNSSAQEPSHVLGAIGLSPERVRGSVRISFGRFTTEADAVRAAHALAAVARRQPSRTA